MVDKTRRTALQMLGLAAVATPVATEKITAAVGDSYKVGFGLGAFVPQDVHRRMVAALRAMADEIELGDSFVSELRVSSKLNHDEFLVHTMAIDFTMKIEGDG